MWEYIFFISFVVFSFVVFIGHCGINVESCSEKFCYSLVWILLLSALVMIISIVNGALPGI